MKLLVPVILLISIHFSYQQSVAENQDEPRSSQCAASQGLTGDIKKYDLKSLIEEQCSLALKNQIKMEFEASITYIAMSAHFSSAAHHRPGLAKFFLASAAEERTHAKKLIEYLLMRGVAIGDAALPPIELGKSVTLVPWTSAKVALEQAYTLEMEVTKSIKKIIKECETGKDGVDGVGGVKDMNDYHAVDYLTGEFLSEQHEGLRTISEYMTTLRRMDNVHLGEVLFDKTLLKD